MLQSLDQFDRIDDGYGEFSDNPEEAEDPEEGFSNLVDGADAILLEDSRKKSWAQHFRIDGLVRQKGDSTVKKVWEVANDVQCFRQTGWALNGFENFKVKDDYFSSPFWDCRINSTALLSEYREWSRYALGW